MRRRNTRFEDNDLHIGIFLQGLHQCWQLLHHVPCQGIHLQSQSVTCFLSLLPLLFLCGDCFLMFVGG